MVNAIFIATCVSVDEEQDYRVKSAANEIKSVILISSTQLEAISGQLLITLHNCHDDI